MSEENVVQQEETKAPLEETSQEVTREPGRFITADPSLVNDLKELGGDSIKKCFQCATCSVICNLSPDDKPFPRKEMIWGQWGLKDKIVSDPDIWLCHQCQDCTAYCPRGARPGEVLAAMRYYTFRHYSSPSFIAKAVSKAQYLWLILAFPVILFLIVLGASGHLHIPEGEIVFSKFMPLAVIDGVFIPVVILVLIVLIKGLTSFWKGMEENFGKAENGGFKGNIVPTIKEILAHSRFKECVTQKGRYTAHLLIFYGFLGLFIVTNIVFVGADFLGFHTPWSVTTNPVKWLANLSAIALIIGCLIAISNRSKGGDVPTSGPNAKAKSSYFDWAFLWILLGTGVTGLFTELIRLAGIKSLAYTMYFIHIVFVFYIIAYLPYSKLAHLAYRAVAMTYARAIGRKKSEI